MGKEFGITLTFDTGRRLTRLGVEWPVLHMLSRDPFGWTLSRDVCAGDPALESQARYDDPARAVDDFHELVLAAVADRVDK